MKQKRRPLFSRWNAIQHPMTHSVLSFAALMRCFFLALSSAAALRVKLMAGSNLENIVLHDMALSPKPL